MAVDAIGGTTSTSTYTRTDVASDNTEITMTQFYQLLAAQLQYQDPDSPLDTSEMMAQMVEVQMISAIETMQNQNLITYAASMIGKEVTVQELDADGRAKLEDNGYVYTSGTVTGVNLSGDDPTIYVDGQPYALSQLAGIGDAKLGTSSSGETESA